MSVAIPDSLWRENLCTVLDRLSPKMTKAALTVQEKKKKKEKEKRTCERLGESPHWHPTDVGKMSGQGSVSLGTSPGFARPNKSE